MTDAINEINSELSAQGITAKVRTFAELVESISDPQWRNALEVYLRNNKFNLIIDSQYTGEALEIFHRKKYYKLSLVLTDKLESYKANPGSAAELLNIPNREARLYANYLLGRLHLCANLEELHNHPKGGIMVDGSLAQGITARNLDFTNMEYSFKANEKKDRAAFFRIKHKLFDDVFQLNDFIVQKIDEDPELHQDIMDFLDTILKEVDDDEYTDYRTYYSYDM